MYVDVLYTTGTKKKKILAVILKTNNVENNERPKEFF